MIKKDGSIFRGLSRKNDFTVLVNLTPETKDLEFFVVHTSELNEWLVSDFEAWVKAPGKNGRPHNPTKKKPHLNYPNFAKRLKLHLHNWVSL